MVYVSILLIFFASGIIALGYQVLWSKYLLDFIGVGSYSYATVLAAFMLGLALGSWFIGKIVDRTRSPLKLYAYLELGIGIYALLYRPLSSLAASFYGSAVQFTPDEAGGSVGLGMKIVVSALLLLLPTTLMGGTYPALLRHVTQNMSSLGKRASQLYSINAFGAVAGSLLMAFCLMPLIGMSGSLMLLALANAVLALLAFLISGSESSEAAVPKETAAPPPEIIQESTYSAKQIRLGFLFIAIEGFFAFVYEIGWTRYFAITLGSSTYSFAVILAVFISGIAIGSAVLSSIEKRIGNPLMFFGFTQVAAALWVILSLPFYPFMPWLFLKFSGLLSMETGAFYLYEFGKVIFCYAVMLPAAVFIGMAVPLVVKGLSRSLENLGHDVGRIFAFNTWGNVTGALAAGMLLLPLLGMERLLYFAAAGTAVLGIAAIALFSPRDAFFTKYQPVRTLSIAVAVTLLIAMLAWPWDPMMFTLFPFRRKQALSYEMTKRTFQGQKILMFKDDPAAHLIVKNNRGGIHLYVNGKIDASTGVDMATQILSAHLPLVLKPQAKEVLVIGLASGVTSGSVLKHPVTRLDIVDIVRSMPEASDFFAPWNGRPLKDKRTSMIIDDARSYLSYTRQKYDLIISEPSNPWMAGTGSLFSKEFYERAKLKLNHGGVFLQWLQCYEMSNETFAAVVRSFTKSFDYVYAFQTLPMEMLLIASDQPIQPDWSSMEKRIAMPAIGNDMKLANVPDLNSMLLLQALSPASMSFIGEMTDLENNDDNHLLEYRAPVDLFRRSTMSLIEQYDERRKAPSTLLWSELNSSNADTARFEKSVISLKPLLAAELSKDLLAGKFYADGTLQPNQQFPVSPPPGPEAVTSSVRSLIGQKEYDLAGTVISSFTNPAIISSTLSEARAEFWLTHVREWAAAVPTDHKILNQLRAFYIDILLAQRNPNATAEIVAFTKSKTPPSREWVMLRAMRLGNQDLVKQIVQLYDQPAVP